jgi:hypothetical protein
MVSLDAPVPDPGPPGPYGTMAWLRARVSRFANGGTHARRRAAVEALIAQIELPERASAPYEPVAVLAAALGADRDVVEDVRTVAAAYHPGTDAPGADAALGRLLAALPEPGREHRVAILVQACEATAALIGGEALPVKTTKRVDPGGRVVLVSLEGRPFGAGSRRCPGEHLARAFA